MGQKATDPKDSPPLKFQAPENIALLNSPAPLISGGFIPCRHA